MPLTPAKVTKAWATYLLTGNKSEAARAIGCNETTIRKLIKRKLGDSHGKAELHGIALVEAEIEARELMRLVRVKLQGILRNPDATPSDIREAAAGVHEGAKVTSHIRVNNAKVMNKLVERQQITVSESTLTIVAPPEVEPE